MPIDPQLRLLVVHDDPGVVATIADALPGAHVGGTEHGDLAVREAAAFDVVVVDLDREPVDGWFLLARLAPVAATVVALGAPRHAARARALGAHAVVGDPALVGPALVGSVRRRPAAA